MAGDQESVEIPEGILAATEATQATTLGDEASRPDVDRAMPLEVEAVEQQGLEVGRGEALAETGSPPIAMEDEAEKPETLAQGCDDTGDGAQTLEISVARELTGGGMDQQRDHPQALLEVARLQLAANQPEEAEEKARCILEMAACDEETSLAAAEVLLQLSRKKASRGDLVGAAEGLGWLRGRMLAGFLPAYATQRLVDVTVELLGRCAGEHLEELTALPSVTRGEVLLAVRRAERLLEAGRLRSAADELFRIVSRHPDFLPAQSMLGKVLAAQGRTEEARARSERLLGLYELRAAPEQALEVLWWSAGLEIAGEGGSARLGELLRAQGRFREAELLELGLLGSGLWDSEPLALETLSWPNSTDEVLLPDQGPEEDELPGEQAGDGQGDRTVRFARSPEPRTLVLAVQGSPKPGRDAGSGLPAEAMPSREEVASDQDSCGLEDASEAEEPREVGVGDAGEGTTRLGEKRAGAQEHGRETGGGRSPWDELLAVAESQFAQGDRSGAAALLALAVESQGGVGLEDRAAMIRALQMIAPEDKLVGELPGLLERLGLPEELAQ